MEIRERDAQSPFHYQGRSTIRSLLDLSNAPMQNQHLEEASIPTGTTTQRHFHQLNEEFYFLFSGHGLMEIDGEKGKSPW